MIFKYPISFRGDPGVGYRKWVRRRRRSQASPHFTLSCSYIRMLCKGGLGEDSVPLFEKQRAGEKESAERGERERARERESSTTLVLSNACNSQGLVRLKPGARYSIWFFCVSGRDSSIRATPAASQVHRQEAEVEVGLDCRHSDMGCVHPKWQLSLL